MPQNCLSRVTPRATFLPEVLSPAPAPPQYLPDMRSRWTSETQVVPPSEESAEIIGPQHQRSTDPSRDVTCPLLPEESDHGRPTTDAWERCSLHSNVGGVISSLLHVEVMSWLSYARSRAHSPVASWSSGLYDSSGGVMNGTDRAGWYENTGLLSW